MRRRRWFWVSLLAAIALDFGCFAFVTRTASVSDEEEDIYEAVFRYQFAHSVPVQPSMHAFFLRVQSVNPPATLLRRFDGNWPPVLPGWQFRTGTGVLYQVGDMERTGEDTATVGGGYYQCFMAASGGNAYFVVRENGRWVVEHQRLGWIAQTPTRSVLPDRSPNWSAIDAATRPTHQRINDGLSTKVEHSPFSA